jgi:hypothetical protein
MIGRFILMAVTSPNWSPVADFSSSEERVQESLQFANTSSTNMLPILRG